MHLSGKMINIWVSIDKPFLAIFCPLALVTVGLYILKYGNEGNLVHFGDRRDF